MSNRMQATGRLVVQLVVQAVSETLTPRKHDEHAIINVSQRGIKEDNTWSGKIHTKKREQASGLLRRSTTKDESIMDEAVEN